MKLQVFVPILLAVSGLAGPAVSQEITREVVVGEIALPDLNVFVGSNPLGFGHDNLGVISTADSSRGIVGVTGRHGEFSLMSASLLTHNGLTLDAPTLTRNDIKVASTPILRAQAPYLPRRMSLSSSQPPVNP